MKKILCALLMGLILISFAACNKNKETESKPETTDEVTDEITDNSSIVSSTQADSESSSKTEQSSVASNSNSASVVSIETTELQTVIYIENNSKQSVSAEVSNPENDDAVSKETQTDTSSKDNWTAYH